MDGILDFGNYGGSELICHLWLVMGWGKQGGKEGRGER